MRMLVIIKYSSIDVFLFMPLFHSVIDKVIRTMKMTLVVIIKNKIMIIMTNIVYYSYHNDGFIIVTKIIMRTLDIDDKNKIFVMMFIM